ncbi:hypothetical protein Back11_08110 [Paenibacillus baekrokdamisoli]|uniref:Uncharacterized protein n=1 Tax=Paenibacillus baekrokdamisoli TaxID=1712516 RepID=A0A3G9IMD2_9BACL|nr:hypothetical protein [Paenibacillus baekrokdamisoli]MBB3067348.1 hypothetical protein [Paenibacillus baekrokdamisoli]BBH19466.1 hypothetical protein Back11_08110 [Paenibacillus baekrokdamisoli]
MRKWIPLYAALVILLASSHVSAAAQTLVSQPELKQQQSKLEQQVQTWTNILTQQAQFRSWKHATPNIVPIGPGMHGWLVTFLIDHKPVGYMIVDATEDNGFALSEYGVGEHPAFDPNTLYQSMIRQGYFTSYADAVKKPLKIERLYVHPLLAVWKWYSPDGQTVYMDAWTGESLPINDQIWKKQTEASSAKVKKEAAQPATLLSLLSASRTNETFDPYERMPWLTKSPLTSEQVTKLPELLNHKAQIRFTAELYDKSVLFVFPTIGYHCWNNNSIYVAFDQEGTRYVSLNTIKTKGLFYP